MIFDTFRDSIAQDARTDRLRSGLIGEGMPIPGLFGDVPLVYADYVASGRALRQVERFVSEDVLPYYANSHTEASFCGSYITRMRRAARAEIARIVGAHPDDAVIFAGSGATAGLNRLVNLLGLARAEDAVVLIGPYEHHSNILPWRESGARVIEIPEAPEGGPDLAALERTLDEVSGADLVIGSFSAASNVTGIITDPDPVTRMLKRHGALAIWDYAGAGPYLPIDMGSGDVRKDAIVVSPHKFPGGPGASGILVVNAAAVQTARPSWPGGGTVSFVSPWRHDYVDDLAAREEAGTPNVIGDIRAALAFLVKDAVGAEFIAEREARYNRMALDGWRDNPHLTLLGAEAGHRLPIFSFLVRDAEGQPVHQQLFTRMLSDIHGIQARGGCACAGPYAHRLLGIDRAASDALHADLAAGRELRKPGWVRLNLSYLMDEATVRFIIDSVNDLSRRTGEYSRHYRADPATARFTGRAA
ncbi:Selenocysteine lyase/Cysteine desulfurase [Cribrihabitans marinus]|uniref:Selenocysteine lyase/Cysteine desulfurase n=1 Tax=Cribrihabitans marinus TaxID=1227549 RepID=A0A1H7AHG5_9RHOB|nr:aminotransferase class V-fold PLP-dependent enzyme [Cribrihabitans marinus]GGH31569.1 aminotransferase class V [Cribrihabitans marinus]SEJ64004.1 Selenocysteine lyase/Cysteine desulfurase [Cribrihabitans marinus]